MRWTLGYASLWISPNFLAHAVPLFLQYKWPKSTMHSIRRRLRTIGTMGHQLQFVQFPLVLGPCWTEQYLTSRVPGINFVPDHMMSGCIVGDYNGWWRRSEHVKRFYSESIKYCPWMKVHTINVCNMYHNEIQKNMISPRIELGTFCVLSRCHNRLDHETVFVMKQIWLVDQI